MRADTGYRHAQRSDRLRPVTRYALFLPLALLAAPALAQRGPVTTPAGNPGALIAVEGALSRVARDKGAGAALEDNAAETAEMFGPGRMPWRVWLKAHGGNFPGLAQRTPGSAWTSCDASAGVTYGLWTDGNHGGWFATVWTRDRKGRYRWVLGEVAPLATMPPAPDWITGKVGDCPARPHRGDDAAEPPQPPSKGPQPPRPLPAAIPAADPGSDSRDGRSDDGSLVWRTSVAPDGTVGWRVWLYQDGAMTLVLQRDVAPGQG